MKGIWKVGKFVHRSNFKVKVNLKWNVITIKLNLKEISEKYYCSRQKFHGDAWINSFSQVSRFAWKQVLCHVPLLASCIDFFWTQYILQTLKRFYYNHNTISYAVCLKQIFSIIQQKFNMRVFKQISSVL